MLKGIPNVISPELLKSLDEMGHGDEIVLSDGNFPGTSNARNLVRADGHGVLELLEAVLQLFPLDTYEKPVYIMDKGDNPTPTPIWNDFEKMLVGHTDERMEKLERFAFYERSRHAYAIVQTSEKALYANIILKKGVL